ncbi:hypothetical protein TBLA_0B09930 [Henningerozyma blattae CBS 6284]|uniref:tRNA-binding domain-containing protein n=1 Tax=Henningerozyma blattae (strain ATCC 34711 / CBS 6284 / DSM 70876 / NBRC 10599 / NRRL Y-10934 / UCD 77-7) TaxID=1071380 RepID=I2H0A9_HENB6|nr:hypothetical protein TBLA_0B09930 [Tetrapisispora blattae CBS 6284]CCH59811.1 hypothetical protein TBLA_0B09930 [Tetrapisispora blattae CBS 6284]
MLKGSVFKRFHHFARLDLRIGHVNNVIRHPSSSKLYVLQVQTSNLEPLVNKQICSGLQEHIPIENLQNQFVVVLENIKKCKLRGEVSEAMLLCGVQQSSTDVNNNNTNSSVTSKVVLCKPLKTNPDLIGQRILLKSGITCSPPLSKLENKELVKRLKSKEWDDISSRLKVSSNGDVVYIQSEKEIQEANSNNIEDSLVVWSNELNEYIPIKVQGLPEGSSVC